MQTHKEHGHVYKNDMEDADCERHDTVTRVGVASVYRSCLKGQQRDEKHVM